MNRAGGSSAAWGREREDPTAVVGDDDPQVNVAFGESHQCRVVHEGDVGRPASVRPVSAGPSAVDTTPSIPLAPRLACTRARPRRTTRGHEAGIEEATTNSASSGNQFANPRHTRLGRPDPATGVRVSVGTLVGPPPTRHPRSVRGTLPAVQGRRGGGKTRATLVIRVDHTWSTNLKDGSPARHECEDFRGGWTTRTRTIWGRSPGELGMAQDRVEGRDGEMSTGTAPDQVSANRDAWRSSRSRTDRLHGVRRQCGRPR